ncbi:MAG: 2-phosphosulfolactate phosphatase [Planctomycetes bacterium]|nr:2-phosphosulfolactate phosphatase [Planctomycetota bacterium]
MPQHHLNVHNLPRDVAERELAGSVVVIDLLRASSTICQALASGADEVVPFLEVEEALAASDEAGRSEIVLGGERKGSRISGFDLGNSPCEYMPEAVAGRRVFFTTTNGTRALHHARLARRILVGAFVNLSAIAASVQDEPRVDILCAGTGGGETREDILAAGAMASRLAELWRESCDFNAAANAARREWEQVVARAASAGRPLIEQLAVELQDTQGGRNLLGIGLDRDLVDCAKIDNLSVVPKLDVPHWRITL